MGKNNSPHPGGQRQKPQDKSPSLEGAGRGESQASRSRQMHHHSQPSRPPKNTSPKPLNPKKKEGGGQPEENAAQERTTTGGMGHSGQTGPVEERKPGGDTPTQKTARVREAGTPVDKATVSSIERAGHSGRKKAKMRSEGKTGRQKSADSRTESQRQGKGGQHQSTKEASGGRESENGGQNRRTSKKRGGQGATVGRAPQDPKRGEKRPDKKGGRRPRPKNKTAKHRETDRRGEGANAQTRPHH